MAASPCYRCPASALATGRPRCTSTTICTATSTRIASPPCSRATDERHAPRAKSMSTERPLTGNRRADGAPRDLREYERTGGYQALRKALRELSPNQVTQLVTESGLRGRGGAGFPTGTKWSFVPMGDEAPRPK